MAMEIKDDALYKLREISKELGISKDALRRSIREGKLRANKLGRELVVWGADFRDFVNGRGRDTHAGYGDRDLFQRSREQYRENEQKRRVEQ